MAILFAATYPERTNALMLYGTFARLTRADDYPFGVPPAVLSGWLGVAGRAVRAPGRAAARRRRETGGPQTGLRGLRFRPAPARRPPPQVLAQRHLRLSRRDLTASRAPTVR